MGCRGDSRGLALTPMRTSSTASLGFAFFAVTACGGSSVSTGATCGAGTMLVNGQCVAVMASGGGGGESDSKDAAGGASGGGGMANTADTGADATGADGAAIPNACPNPTPPPSSTFDDFEDGSLRGWYTASDPSGTVSKPTPVNVVGGAPGSMMGLQFSGMGFMSGATNYGAFVARGAKCTDVSGYAGLTFWAKGNTPLLVQVVTPRTTPVALGGECSATETCFDVPGHVFQVSDTWKQYSVAWSQLTQGGWGYKDDFATRKVINSIQFEANDAKDAPNGMFELDIDDVSFVKADAGL